MYPIGIHGGLNWYMVSCKGQHASSDIALVSKHAPFVCYMGEFGRLGEGLPTGVKGYLFWMMHVSLISRTCK